MPNSVPLGPLYADALRAFAGATARPARPDAPDAPRRRSPRAPRAHGGGNIIVAGGGTITVYQGVLGNQVKSLNVPDVSLTVPVGPDVFGSWVQLVASMPEDGVLFQMTYSAGGTQDRGFNIELGSGAAGSEVPLGVRIPVCIGGAAGLDFYRDAHIELPVGVRLTAGVRYAARARQSGSTIRTGTRIALSYLPRTLSLLADGFPFGQDAAPAAYTIDELRATSVPIICVTGGAPSTYGAYVQLVAATAQLLRVAGVSAVWTGGQAVGDYVDVEIATGAAGAEVPLGVARFRGAGVNAGITAGVGNLHRLDSAVQVPAGARIAARAIGTRASISISTLVMVVI